MKEEEKREVHVRKLPQNHFNNSSEMQKWDSDFVHPSVYSQQAAKRTAASQERPSIFEFVEWKMKKLQQEYNVTKHQIRETGLTYKM
ncbi:hypothetical protein AVEN_262453-1 [Araneus ventricosus]|uniref:Uncharacterized protein n=1 Tax=Araneus ventricosus TaxID=182803 RepID=A0A4Y2HTV2_ARAVE|nr:hypothetical protein AVEN_262453-1 [Araneus ventricosus]